MCISINGTLNTKRGGGVDITGRDCAPVLMHMHMHTRTEKQVHVGEKIWVPTFADLLISFFGAKMCARKPSNAPEALLQA